jgi:phosphoribosylaminoimidazolecarboxamide formyltransferase/IMP cyclohydrolase
LARYTGVEIDGASTVSQKIRRALISVSNKDGIVEFAKGLSELGIELVSTGGTSRTLEEAGLPVRPVEDVTGYPEMMEGRVKTLHPRIHGGLLARRDNAEDLKALDEHAIAPIDLLVVNLYPFRQTVANASVTRAQAIENIDIGGPAMLRSAAKNHQDVAVVVNPSDYQIVLGQIRENGGVDDATRRRLAIVVFAHTSAYDSDITAWLRADEGHTDLPDSLTLHLDKATELRYGENPHQKSALYRTGWLGGGVPDATIHQGKSLSYNNLLDLTGAYDLCRELSGGPAAIVVKHTNPCGAAVHTGGLAAAYRSARACDPISAFGGIVALNGEVDDELAHLLTETFLEVIVAPSYSRGALEILSQKKNLRVVSLPLESRDSNLMLRRVDGGYLVQERDVEQVDLSQCQVATERAPSENELKSMQMAWQVCNHVKSNAVLFARGTVTAAIGAGQMSRVDAVNLAKMKAVEPLAGTVLASDAFFPFRDGVDAAFEAGATAVVQPGGSRRDQEVIDACNEHGLAMIFTGKRHFRH